MKKKRQLSYVTRTTSKRKNGKMLWERFTTKPINAEVIPFAAFQTHYNLSLIEGVAHHTDLGDQHHYRKSDLIRCTGIRMHFDISIMPKSGYKLRIMLLQTPYEWTTLAPVDANDGKPFPANQGNPQGGYDLMGDWFTQLHVTDTGIETELQAEFCDLFAFQRGTYDHIEFDQFLHRVKVTHPYVKTLYDEHFVVSNRSTLPKMKKINRMYSTQTTWKYPPRIHDNVVEEEFDNTPDRKVHFFMIATPLHGSVLDPGQDMYNIDLDEPIPVIDRDNEKLKPVAHRPMRGGSVVDDRFGEEVKMEEMVAEEGSSRVTRSMTQQRDSTDFPDLRGEEDEVRNMVRALELNRQFAKAEREERERDKVEEPKPPKAPKPPKKPKIETNAYGWALNNTIMIRPTFQVFWYNLMNRRSALRA